MHLMSSLQHLWPFHHSVGIIVYIFMIKLQSYLCNKYLIDQLVKLIVVFKYTQKGILCQVIFNCNAVYCKTCKKTPPKSQTPEDIKGTSCKTVYLYKKIRVHRPYMQIELYSPTNILCLVIKKCINIIIICDLVFFNFNASFNVLFL